MSQAIMRRMTGEELLVMRIFGGQSVAAAISNELDRRATAGPPCQAKTEAYWAGRNFAGRHSARLVA